MFMEKAWKMLAKKISKNGQTIFKKKKKKNIVNTKTL